MRRQNILAVAIAAVLGLAAAGCADNPVGRVCFIGTDAGNDTQAIIASPALECPSRTCLHEPLQPGAAASETDYKGTYADLCTAECAEDGECDKVPESPCVSGFTCKVAVQVGPFCCRKMCICKDYVVIPDGGVKLPAACDPNIAENKCCNLPGRETEPQCTGD